jgi:hypothetical protein
VRRETLNPHCHSAAGEEYPLFLSFRKTLKHEILHFVQDDKERPNGVILQPAKNLIFPYYKRGDPSAYSIKMTRKANLQKFWNRP